METASIWEQAFPPGMDVGAIAFAVILLTVVAIDWAGRRLVKVFTERKRKDGRAHADE